MPVPGQLRRCARRRARRTPLKGMQPGSPGAARPVDLPPLGFPGVRGPVGNRARRCGGEHESDQNAGRAAPDAAEGALRVRGLRRPAPPSPEQTAFPPVRRCFGATRYPGLPGRKPRKPRSANREGLGRRVAGRRGRQRGEAGRFSLVYGARPGAPPSACAGGDQEQDGSGTSGRGRRGARNLVGRGGILVRPATYARLKAGAGAGAGGQCGEKQAPTARTPGPRSGRGQWQGRVES